MPLTRRQAIAGAAALPLAPTFVGAARAEAPMLGATQADIRRFTLGGFEVTTMLVGLFPRENPQEMFAVNVEAEEFAAVSRENFLSPDRVTLPFTPTVVNTGSELILFDTGLNAAGLLGALASAGYAPEQVDTVVITHMHGDHVGGLLNEGAPTLPNARYVTGATEFNYWAGAGNETFESNVRPLAEQFTFIGDSEDVSGGITGMAAYGHTPGHMVFRIESEGQALLLFADLANHPVWSLAHPDWHFGFDVDKDLAVESRRRVLSMLAAERLPAIGYHMPFPSLGYVDTDGDGFRWVPETGQLAG